MNRKLIFLLIAFLGVCCFVLIGIAIAERSLLGALAAFAASIGIIGYGFTLKKKWREADSANES